MRKKPIDYERFLAYLVSGAKFEGKYGIPIIRNQKIKVPNKIVPFAKRDEIKRKDKERTFVHFYMDFDLNMKLIQNIRRYTRRILKFGGMISPDPSLFFDIPLAVQIFNTYLNRACTYCFQNIGIPIIPNVRWGDKESFEFCFAGLKPNGAYSISTAGGIASKRERNLFKNGLHEMLNVLDPDLIVVHGEMPYDIFVDYEESYNFVQFDQ